MLRSISVRLLLIRHAIAVERGTPGLPDAERPLTRDGREKFIEAARGLARIVESPDVIFSSPLVRARQTAQIARDAWDGPKVRDVDALATGDFAALAKAVDAVADKDSVALVGHEPHMSALLARLLETPHDERLACRKGGAALLEIPGALNQGGPLVWFLPPRVLRELGE